MGDLSGKIRRVLGVVAGRQPQRRASYLQPDEELARRCRVAVEGLGMKSLGEKVRVSWNPRLKTTAGWARWPERSIELNPRLKEVGEEEIWRTLRHELAHLVAQERVGRKRIQAHGREWRSACGELGIPGERACHRLPFERTRMKRRYRYSCPGCHREVERVRKIKGKASCLVCSRQHGNGSYDDRFRLTERRL